ncbi:MAG: CBS domain-containing protein [Methanomassiliicoccales archaeon]|jgi:predicted transcriptional regulator|nr:CBS domain-containing protein [Methanomassiliicoccales archaeon]
MSPKIDPIELAIMPQLPELEKIRQIRQKLGLSQRELAVRAGVSQSLIAKIEKGTIDPSYGNVRKIFQAFEEVLKEGIIDAEKTGIHLTVGDLATRGVVSISPDDTIAEAIERMVKGRFTQLPVVVGDRVVGSITDDIIRNYTIEQTKNKEKSYDEVMKTPVSEIMEAPFPILSEDTPIELASLHLQRQEAVLVSRKGVVIGILTSADFLNIGIKR